MVAGFVQLPRRMSPETASVDQGPHAVGIGWMLDYTSGVQIVYMDGRVTDASFDAYAMATPSAAVRAGLRMLFWLAPPPYPNAVVATTLEAFEFIARHQPALAPEALAAEFARKVAVAEFAMAGP
jgi:hypothetical protein